MKFTVSFKDPDTFGDAIRDAVEDDVKALGLSAREAESVAEIRAEEVQNAIGHFVEYGEYIRIEFDTEARTARVVPFRSP